MASRTSCAPSPGWATSSSAAFYRDLAPHLGIEVPQCWYAELSTEQNQGLVVIDDLRVHDAVFGRPGDPYTVDQVATGLELQATWDARTWDRSGPVSGRPGSPSGRRCSGRW